MMYIYIYVYKYLGYKYIFCDILKSLAAVLVQHYSAFVVATWRHGMVLVGTKVYVKRGGSEDIA